MIVSIGCDIVEHKVSQKLDWEKDINVQNRIFSIKELQLYSENKQLQFLSGRFAVKEAVLKCLSIGMEDGISLTEIETLQTKNGLPYIKLAGKPLLISTQLGIEKWHISITHSSNYSQAFVIAER
ncbi:holo-ACP synthase [Chryseobacterium sp. MFBS3-17]|uniref:holo-ACP synthase n=1 Tax=Chryseobacterium sp. MFBS3-17 TaxID=2886689 RepID=UPI001D0DF6AC|nr:holo-ACP synthase [Chryseobacterium sp. MFBS3-17]MCC2590305.1 holo-ACP synthase [Chryseobacterium sp. MFBS3-17]